MKWKNIVRGVALLCVALLVFNRASSQFIDAFNGKALRLDPRGVHGWTYFTGDGSATMTFSEAGKGYASIVVDATKDRRGIWWALIKRRVSESMNLGLLHDPHHALRIEARIRLSDAPKRVNLHLNTQRTTDFHTHLMEFDIPDTTRWHTISMTTHGFDAVPGDSAYGQLALMDWGLEKYRVDIDYFKVDIVNIDTVGEDLGIQVSYHPFVPKPETFNCHARVAQDCMIDLKYPDLNFNNWSTKNEEGQTYLLTATGEQFIILRWELREYSRQAVTGPGLLELTTYSLQRSPEYSKDFGMIRIAEIIGGDPSWDQRNVTANTLCNGLPLTKVLNSQMIIDIDVNQVRGGKTFATIPKIVLQRLIEGKTFGLVIKPLGAVIASLYASENRAEALAAHLHFNLQSSSDPVPQR